MKPYRKQHKLPLIRNRYFFIADVLLTPLIAVVSFSLRLDPSGLEPYYRTILVFAVLAVIIKPATFYLFGLYRRFWRYASTNELISIFLASLASTVLVTLLSTVILLSIGFRPLPRSIPFIEWLVSLVLIGGIRLAVHPMADAWRKLTHNRQPRAELHSENRVLVMGAGDAGAMIVREMWANPHMGLLPIGFVDDDQAKLGMVIHGVPVLGSRDDIPRLVQEQDIEEVIIAMPTAPGRAIRGVVGICQETSVACKTIPGIYELISGKVSVTQVRDVRIEDLLRREPVQINGRDTGRYLSGKVVLVTGAGGSIGSELCRQIAQNHPRQLLLLGHGENSIFHIQNELEHRFPNLITRSLIADVRDSERLESVFRYYEPRVVFHAAAHKHVPLMECNVAEAVMNNVFGTRSLLRVSEAHDVEHFVFISTDKAVNPVCVMGVTKRLSEMLVQDVARRTGANFVAVRFGNVLGSRGSVIPFFQRQIAAGGPVTVTHPDVDRYFMTIPEAVQLVIQAAALGQGGEVFVLDMGEPVRIADLAAELIRLSGLEPGRDIEIVFTGLRPGEKLSEELFAEGENPCCTHRKEILVAQGNNHWASGALTQHLQELAVLAKEGRTARICAKLQEVVPEYRLEVSPPEAFRRVFVDSRKKTDKQKEQLVAS